MNSRNIDFILLIISILIMLSSLFYLKELFSIEINGEKHLFSKYITNPGIIKIELIRLTSATLISILVLTKIKSNGKGKIFPIILLSLLLGMMSWLELWYGSTFYYGEMRDKHGLGFPYFTTLYLLYPIWITKNEISKPTILKIVSSIALLIFLIIFFNLVYEPWKLWQS